MLCCFTWFKCFMSIIDVNVFFYIKVRPNKLLGEIFCVVFNFVLFNFFNDLLLIVRDLFTCP